MKRLLKITVLLLVVGMMLGLAGCEPPDNGGDYDKYYLPTFRGNNNGSVEIVNPTQHDMLLFKNKSLLENSIVGGVRASDDTTITFSDESDFIVGGYKILYAVKESEYKRAGGNSNIDYTGMVTYRNGARFRIQLQSRYDGNYRFTAFNRNTDYPLELRKNSPDGEKIGFLARGETWHRIRTTDTSLVTIYPVWIAYNTASRSIVSFCPKDDILSVQTVQPKTEADDTTPYYFPGGGTNTITFDIDLPFATIRVQNNAYLLAVFRIANSIETSQEGYDGIASGNIYTYEIRATEIGLNLNLAIGPTQNLIIPVRYEEYPEQNPIIDNGWIYTVELNLKAGFDGTLADHYTAWLVKDQEINQSTFLTAD